mmetsp:Transcript_22184/g.39936  ORF Transcript_22184/g.39936 Transcript_22184/m.39936 type:complete len:351 (-) Transcript_22184:77-1129(-)
MAPHRQTTHWRANEVSLARSSFNAIVTRQKMDVTEVMMRHSSMGRQAEMGPEWCPSGLVTRQITEALAAKKTDHDKLPLRLRQAAEAAEAREAKRMMPWAANEEVTGSLQYSQQYSQQYSRSQMEQEEMTPRAQFEESDYMAQPEEPARASLPKAQPRDSDWGSTMSSPVVEERKAQRLRGTNMPMRPRVAPAWGMATSTSPRSPTRSPTPVQVPASPSPVPAIIPSPVPKLPVQQGGLNSSAPASARAPLAPKRSGFAQDSVTSGESMPPVQRPSSAMSGPRGPTTHWRPNEQSLLRNSFNSIVGQKKLDVTEVMMRDASMGRQAEMGEGWTPGGLVSRRMAEKLTARN